MIWAVPQKLDMLPVCIVNQEQMRLRVLCKVAAGDELSIAAKISKGDRLFIKDVQKTGRTAPML